MKVSTCRYCPAQIVWLLTSHDRVMPINVEFMRALVGNVERARAERYDSKRHGKGVHACRRASRAR